MFVSSKYFNIKKYPTRTQVIRSIENDRDNKHIIIHLSSSNACSYQIMDYSCTHRRFGTRCCTNIVKCELNCVVNISLTVLDHIVHVSSSNLCSRQIMDYSCNHRRFGTRCCTDRVQCKLSCVIYSHTFVATITKKQIR